MDKYYKQADFSQIFKHQQSNYYYISKIDFNQLQNQRYIFLKKSNTQNRDILYVCRLNIIFYICQKSKSKFILVKYLNQQDKLKKNQILKIQYEKLKILQQQTVFDDQRKNLSFKIHFYLNFINQTIIQKVDNQIYQKILDNQSSTYIYKNKVNLKILIKIKNTAFFMGLKLYNQPYLVKYSQNEIANLVSLQQSNKYLLKQYTDIAFQNFGIIDFQNIQSLYYCEKNKPLQIESFSFIFQNKVQQFKNKTTSNIILLDSENNDTKQQFFYHISLPVFVVIIIFLIVFLSIIISLVIYYCRKKNKKIVTVTSDIKITIKYQKIQKNQGQEQCVICLQKLSYFGCNVIPCNHRSYHNVCIQQWISKNTTCPMCRIPIRQLQLINQA